ncbi:MAG: beta-N-acetylhexosaminidase, partial [Chitinophagaceae bacterium]
MKKLLFLLICGASITAIAQTPNLIPKPASFIETKGAPFRLVKNIHVYNGFNEKDTNHPLYRYLQQFLKTHYNIETIHSVQRIGAQLVLLPTNSMEAENGGYRLQVGSQEITIECKGEEGAFYAIQSLFQLLPASSATSISIPLLEIRDQPRFVYRGMHLDVGRHFYPVSYIKQYLDYLALHKINRFHWHLTEDQGWRIAIKKYPALTTIGAWRNGTIVGRYPGTGNNQQPYGGFYTQEEIKEVVQYAKDRYIEVIPEIEMPGHSSAAIAAYPWLSCFPDQPTHIPENMISEKSKAEQQAGRVKLVQETWGIFDDVFCAGKESTFQFLQDVIDELLPLFPAKYFHIGGDECPKT